ncbi:MAG: hypothetical protein ACRC51_05850 [Cetobacterium sp.]
MALTEKKLEILDEYLKNKCVSRIEAVKAIDPTIKNPKVYAYKLFNESEFKDELAKRRRELLMHSSIDTQIVVKALSKELYGSLGLIDRTVLAHGKNGFDTIHGKYSDSTAAKNYWGIIKDILGPEVSTVLAMEDVKESKNYTLREESFKLEKQKAKLENEKLKNENKPVQETNITDVRKKHGL